MVHCNIYVDMYCMLFAVCTQVHVLEKKNTDIDGWAPVSAMININVRTSRLYVCVHVRTYVRTCMYVLACIHMRIGFCFLVSFAHTQT